MPAMPARRGRAPPPHGNAPSAVVAVLASAPRRGAGHADAFDGGSGPAGGRSGRSRPRPTSRSITAASRPWTRCRLSTWPWWAAIPLRASNAYSSSGKRGDPSPAPDPTSAVPNPHHLGLHITTTLHHFHHLHPTVRRQLLARQGPVFQTRDSVTLTRHRLPSCCSDGEGSQRCPASFCNFAFGAGLPDARVVTSSTPDSWPPALHQPTALTYLRPARGLPAILRLLRFQALLAIQGLAGPCNIRYVC